MHLMVKKILAVASVFFTWLTRLVGSLILIFSPNYSNGALSRARTRLFMGQSNFFRDFIFQKKTLYEKVICNTILICEVL